MLEDQASHITYVRGGATRARIGEGELRRVGRGDTRVHGRGDSRIQWGGAMRSGEGRL